MELTEREKLIIEFYEDGKIPTIIAIYDIWKKEKIKNAIRYINKLVKHRYNRISNNGNNSTWNNGNN